jgi:integrase
MPSLFNLAEQYLAHRRKLGFTLSSQGRHVIGFAQFADRVAHGQPLKTSLVLQWASQPKSQYRGYLAARLTAIRNFARYCATIDPRSEVPAARLLGPMYQRRTPHIYPSGEISVILRCARALPTDHSVLHARTYETMIGLIAATGLRPSEAVRLRLIDFDPPAALLRVLPAKTSPLRCLPLHPSTVRALQDYQRVRWQAFPFGERFFVGLHGWPVQLHQLEHVFKRLARSVSPNGARPAPRLMDLRHTFATKLIAQWVRQKAPVAHRLLLLSRYLGHRHFISTWWYVSSDPTALRSAGEQFRRFHGEPRDSHG